MKETEWVMGSVEVALMADEKIAGRMLAPQVHCPLIWKAGDELQGEEAVTTE